VNKGERKGRGVTRFALGIEPRRVPTSLLLDEASALQEEGYGRSKGEHL
jgi:hypothetical protein